MIDDPWAICVSSARKLGMWQEEASHRAARVDRDGLEARHANNNDDDDLMMIVLGVGLLLRPIEP